MVYEAGPQVTRIFMRLLVAKLHQYEILILDLNELVL